MDVVNAFVLPADRTDTATLLRSLEAQAPKHIKTALVQAAQELEDWQKLADRAARELDEASRLSAGQMASQSRHDEIARQVKLTMTSLAQTFRELA